MKTAASSSLFSVSHPLAQYHSPNLEGHLSFLDSVEQTPTPFSLVDHSVSEEWDVTDSVVQLSELSLSPLTVQDAAWPSRQRRQQAVCRWGWMGVGWI